MKATVLKIAAAAGLMAGVATGAMAQQKNVTIGVSIPAATHGWTGGVVYHAQETAKQLEKTYPGHQGRGEDLARRRIAGERARRSDLAEGRCAGGPALQLGRADEPRPRGQEARHLHHGGRPRPQGSVDPGHLRGRQQPRIRPRGRQVLRRQPEAGQRGGLPRHPDRDRRGARDELREGSRRLGREGDRQAIRQLEPRRCLQGDAGLPRQASEDRRGLGLRRRHGARHHGSHPSGASARTSSSSSAAPA